MKNRKGHSPYTDTIVEYVRKHSGCCKFDVAKHVSTKRHPSKQYYLVNTQIRLGNIVAVMRKGRYWLYLPGDKRSEV